MNDRRPHGDPFHGVTAPEIDALVRIARHAIEQAVRTGARWRPDPGTLPEALRRPAGAFVTLHEGDRLRGCVGRMESSEPLGVTVAEVARSAALEDPRFRPVRERELHHLEVSVSVLTRAEPMDVDSYDELLARVRPGVDGLAVDSGRHRATLLPAVWDDVPDPRDFVGALWRKAGLAPGVWPSGTAVSHYRTHEAHEAHEAHEH
jgi:AmmeMemoRadiSam system protein A